MKIDMWYRDHKSTVDRLDIVFYPNDCCYRGNLYRAGKMIGDYSTHDSVELEKAFPQLVFNWGD